MQFNIELMNGSHPILPTCTNTPITTYDYREYCVVISLHIVHARTFSQKAGKSAGASCTLAIAATGSPRGELCISLRRFGSSDPRECAGSDMTMHRANILSLLQKIKEEAYYDEKLIDEQWVIHAGVRSFLCEFLRCYFLQHVVDHVVGFGFQVTVSWSVLLCVYFIAALICVLRLCDLCVKHQFFNWFKVDVLMLSFVIIWYSPF